MFLILIETTNRKCSREMETPLASSWAGSWIHSGSAYQPLVKCPERLRTDLTLGLD